MSSHAWNSKSKHQIESTQGIEGMAWWEEPEPGWPYFYPHIGNKNKQVGWDYKTSTKHLSNKQNAKHQTEENAGQGPWRDDLVIKSP